MNGCVYANFKLKMWSCDNNVGEVEYMYYCLMNFQIYCRSYYCSFLFVIKIS